MRVYDLNEADVIIGNSNGFVVKPAAFELTHVLRQPDSMVNPEASDATGPAFTAAGKPSCLTKEPPSLHIGGKHATMRMFSVHLR